jgi:hemerythrin-like domain-containing protein
MKRLDPRVADQVDTRDMIVVHTAMLRELRLAPAAVRRAAARSSARPRARTAGHLRFLLDLLEHHHAGEDKLLLPLLRDRVPAGSAAAVDTGEEQHARIETAIAGTRAGIDRWAGDRGGTPALAEELAAELTALHAVVELHLRAEERDILPLAATYLSTAEWAAIGEAGAAATPKRALPAVFGMFMYEGDPSVLRSMLAPAPAPARVLVPLIAPRAYARLSRRVHGTPRP